MGQHSDRKTISLNMDISDLSRLDYACEFLSKQYGFKVSRTKCINRLVNGFLDSCDINELEKRQIRLSVYDKR